MGRIEYTLVLLTIIVSMAILSHDHVVSSDAVLAIYGAIAGANGAKSAANVIMSNSQGVKDE